MSGPISLFDEKLKDEDLYPAVQAYYHLEWRDFIMKTLHSHKLTEIMYVQSGHSTVQVNDESLTLRKGDLILIDADIPHRLVVGETSCRMMNIEFYFKPLETSFPSMKALQLENRELSGFLKERRSYFLFKDNDSMRHALTSLINSLNAGKHESDLIVQLYLAELFICLAVLFADSKQNGGITGRKYVEKVITYIHEHLDSDIRISDLAAHVSLNVSYLQRIFKKSTGQRLVDYITHHRIEKAKMLLQNTDLPIADICAYVGMNSRQYFSAIFKEKAGSSPAQFRRDTVKVNYHNLEGFIKKSE